MSIYLDESNTTELMIREKLYDLSRIKQWFVIFYFLWIVFDVPYWPKDSIMKVADNKVYAWILIIERTIGLVPFIGVLTYMCWMTF